MATKQAGNLNALKASHRLDLTQEFKSALLKTKPWDSVIDFVQHKSFCGFNSLYPRQKTLLKLIFLETEHMTAYDIAVIEEWSKTYTGDKDSYGVQPDIWERVKYLKDKGYRRFPHIQGILGRRASKGVLGGFLGAEAIAYMISLQNPQSYYGIVEGKEIELEVIATMLDQAKTKQFADIRNIATKCKYLQPYMATDSENMMNFRTPQDIMDIAEKHSMGMSLTREISSIKCNPYSSNSAGSRGSAAFALFLDEFAHFLETEGTRSSTQVYTASKPSLDQFGKDQLLYCASSPYTKIGKFFELYNQGSVMMDEYLEKHPIYGSTDRDEALEKIVRIADPTKLIVQLASWDLYKDWEKSGISIPGPKFPKAVIEYNEEMKIEEQLSPQTFKVERRGQFAEVIDGYLDPDLVDLMFAPYQGEFLTPAVYGKMHTEYHAHCDPGKTNANFALSIGHSEFSGGKDRFGNLVPHVVIDLLKVWKPEDFPKHTIDYEVVKEDLIEITSRYHSLKTFSMDQWNSGSFISFFERHFQKKNIQVFIENATESLNQQRYDTFKMGMNQRMIHSYRDKYYGENKCLLELELKFLQEKNRKVVKQEIGPVTTKDLSDCVVIVSNRLLNEYFHQFKSSLFASSPVATNLSLAAQTGMGTSITMRQKEGSRGQQLSQLSSSIHRNNRMDGYVNRLTGQR